MQSLRHLHRRSVVTSKGKLLSDRFRECRVQRSFSENSHTDSVSATKDDSKQETVKEKGWLR